MDFKIDNEEHTEVKQIVPEQKIEDNILKKKMKPMLITEEAHALLKSLGTKGETFSQIILRIAVNKQ